MDELHLAGGPTIPVPTAASASAAVPAESPIHARTRRFLRGRPSSRRGQSLLRHRRDLYKRPAHVEGELALLGDDSNILGHHIPWATSAPTFRRRIPDQATTRTGGQGGAMATGQHKDQQTRDSELLELAIDEAYQVGGGPTSSRDEGRPAAGRFKAADSLSPLSSFPGRQGRGWLPFWSHHSQVSRAARVCGVRVGFVACWMGYGQAGTETAESSSHPRLPKSVPFPLEC